VGYDGQPAAGIDDLHRLLSEKQLRVRASLTIVRGSEKLDLGIVPEESPARAEA